MTDLPLAAFIPCKAVESEDPHDPRIPRVPNIKNVVLVNKHWKTTRAKHFNSVVQDMYLDIVRNWSIYATLWALQFPRFGEFHIGCEWVTGIAQGVLIVCCPLSTTTFRLSQLSSALVAVGHPENRDDGSW